MKVRVKLLPHASVAVAVAKEGVAGQLIVDGAGNAAITGAVTSCTWITCAAVELLPQSSVAVHVRVTVYDPAQAPCTVTSLKTSVGVTSQASVAVGVAKDGDAGQLMVEGAGKDEMTGATLSMMVITCVYTLLVLPQSSVTTQVFVYVPACGQEPGTNAPEVLTMLVTFASQLSAATGDMACAAAKPTVLLQSSVAFNAPLPVIHVGDWVSMIVMICV